MAPKNKCRQLVSSEVDRAHNFPPHARARGGNSERGQPTTEPPFTNRGVVITKPNIDLSIHWLEITFFTSPRKPMTDFMSIYLPWYLDPDYQWEDDFTLRGSTGRFYKAIYDGPDGIVLYAYPADSTYCSLQISGSAIEKMGQDAIYRLLELYQSRFIEEKINVEEKFHWQCTRIDIAFDGVPFTPAMCREAWLARDARSRIHQKSYDWRSNADGDTFYVGKRVSGRMIRVYNRRGPVRLEIELKKKYAVPFLIALRLSGFQTIGYESLGMIRDMLDFVDRGSNTNLSRADLLPWWKEFVGDVDRIRYTQITRSDSASIEEQRLESFYQRMKPTMFFFNVILGHDLNHAARNTESDLKPHHRSKVLRLRPRYKFDY